MLNIGTVVVFPPYALYLLGNAGVAFAGYEPLYVTDALPEPARKEVLGFYNGVTGVPGRVNALVAGEPYVQGPTLGGKQMQAPRGALEVKQ